MKKHAETLAKIKSEDLKAAAPVLQKEVTELRLGVKLGNVQNYKMISLKKKELARVLGRLNQEERNKK